MPQQIIREIEKAFNIADIVTGKGIAVWPLIKDKLYFELLRKKFQYSSDKRTRSKLQLLKNTFYGFWALLRFPFFKYYMFQNTNKRLIWNGLYFDPYFDAWADKLGQRSCLFIEFASGQYIAGSKVHSKNVSSDLPFYLLAKIISVFCFPKIRSKQVLDDIITAHDIQIGYTRILKEKLGIYYLYKFLFRLSRPKAIFVLSSFTKTPLVLAGKSLGIPVYEAQHGYIGDSHPFYNTQVEFPQAYPDYLLAFGEYEKMNCESLIFSKEAIFPFGSFELEAQKSKPIPGQLEELRAKYDSVFCITLQTIKETELFGSILPYARNNKNALFLICPKDRSKEYTSYTSEENLMLFPQYTVYDILKISDYNITVFSTTAVEAEYFGVKVIFYNANDLSRKYYPVEKMNAVVLEEGQSLNKELLDNFSSQQIQKYFYEDYLMNVEKSAPLP